MADTQVAGKVDSVRILLEGHLDQRIDEEEFALQMCEPDAFSDQRKRFLK